MGRLRSTFVLLTLLALPAVSCSDGTDDAVTQACRVVVTGCHVGTSIGACVDEMGYLPVDCVECIAATPGCGYPACQRLAGCRLSGGLVPDDAFIPGAGGGAVPSDAGADQ